MNCQFSAWPPGKFSRPNLSRTSELYNREYLFLNANRIIQLPSGADPTRPERRKRGVREGDRRRAGIENCASRWPRAARGGQRKGAAIPPSPDVIAGEKLEPHCDA